MVINIPAQFLLFVDIYVTRYARHLETFNHRPFRTQSGLKEVHVFLYVSISHGQGNSIDEIFVQKLFTWILYKAVPM